MRPNSQQQMAAGPKSAFTLIEAVLALAILGISIFALVEATSRCLAIIRKARNYQTARAVLDRGEAVYPIQTTNAPDESSVAPVELLDGFTFSRELEAVDGEVKLYRVVTRVVWSETGKAAREEVVSYAFFPKEEE